MVYAAHFVYKYYLDGEVLQPSTIKPLFHDFSLSERSFLK